MISKSLVCGGLCRGWARLDAQVAEQGGHVGRLAAYRRRSSASCWSARTVRQLRAVPTSPAASVFIVLSTLRLDLWLSLWTGVVAAVEQTRHRPARRHRVVAGGGGGIGGISCGIASVVAGWPAGIAAAVEAVSLGTLYSRMASRLQPAASPIPAVRIISNQ